jgi:hypothetical protein
MAISSVSLAVVLSVILPRPGTEEIGLLLGALAGHYGYVHWRDARAARLADPSRCPHCRYSRHGIDPSAPCPECGRDHPALAERPPAR